MKLRKFLCALCTAALVLSLLPAALADDASAFTDAAQITHWEAVAALCKLGVMTGKDDGAFHPTDTLTRGEAAKLVALIMNGGEVLDCGMTTDPGFSDIEGHWAESYIEYCAELGIIAGRGDGRFDPDSQVTGLELCKMAESALGYDADAYGLKGPRWAEKVDKVARYTDPSLYAELSGVTISAPISRDDAAQILYNALNVTPMVVAPAPTEGGGVTWQFRPATRKDGQKETLLHARFVLDSVGDLPTQPK